MSAGEVVGVGCSGFRMCGVGEGGRRHDLRVNRVDCQCFIEKRLQLLDCIVAHRIKLKTRGL